jgi:hypothetical protein
MLLRDMSGDCHGNVFTKMSSAFIVWKNATRAKDSAGLIVEAGGLSSDGNDGMKHAAFCLSRIHSERTQR